MFMLQNFQGVDDKNTAEDPRFSQMISVGGRGGSGVGRVAKGPGDAQPQHGSTGGHQESPLQMPELYASQQQQQQQQQQTQQQPQQHGKIANGRM
jgi:hypothetical protein